MDTFPLAHDAMSIDTKKFERFNKDPQISRAVWFHSQPKKLKPSDRIATHFQHIFDIHEPTVFQLNLKA